MAKIYVKYSNDNWATETSLDFVYTKLYKKPTRRSIKGVTLNDIHYTHKISSRAVGVYEITISADILYIDEKYGELVDFLTAGAWKASEDNETFIEVDLETDGTFDFEFIRGHNALPQLSFRLLKKYPD